MDLSTALLTIIGSGVAAAGVTYLLNSNKEQIFFMRKKAEDLYSAAEEFDKIFSSATILAFPLFMGTIDYNTYLDQYLEKGQKLDKADSQHALNVNMLTKIYFPQLIDALHGWELSRNNVNSLISDHKRAYKRGDADPEIYFPLLQEKSQKEISASNNFKAAIIKEAQKLASPEALWPESARNLQKRLFYISKYIQSGLKKAYNAIKEKTVR